MDGDLNTAEMSVVDERTLQSVQFGSDGSLQIQQTDLTIKPNEGLLEGQVTPAVDYSVTGDHERFSVGINVGHGPAETTDSATEITTMSGQVQHDIARPVVDFIAYDDAEANVATHLDA